MVRSWAGLDPNETWREFGKEGHELTTSKLPAKQHLAILSNTVDLEHVLGDIETYPGDFHGKLL
jgi:hypothetical protein